MAQAVVSTRCPSCHKLLPLADRFCAYCGAALAGISRLAWLRARLAPQRPALLVAAGGVALGAMAGAVAGELFGDAVLGLLVGASGMGLSGLLAEPIAGKITDAAAATRFGRLYGALGGGLVLFGALLASVIVAVMRGQSGSFLSAIAWAAGGLVLGLFAAIGGAAAGGAFGVLAGSFTARLGWVLGRRPGALIGAALAWTVAGVTGGAIAGDFAGLITQADRTGSALLGMLVQLAAGSLLLGVFSRMVASVRAWWRRRFP